MLVTTLVKYFKKSNYYWGNILKFLYHTGNIIEIPRNHRSLILNTHIDNPEETLAKIITKRKWHYLYDPTVLNLIIKIYKKQEGNLIKEVIDELKMRIIQFFCVWTLSNIIPIPVTAFLLRMRDPYPKNIGMPLLDTVFIFFYPRERMWISLFSSFAGYLNCSLVYSLMYKSWQIIPYLMHILFHQQKYNFYLLASIPTIYYLSQLPYAILFLPFVARYNFIYLWMVTFGIFSAYHPGHLLVLTIVLYLFVNVADYENATNHKIDYKLISSYYRNTVGNLTNTVYAPPSYDYT